MFFAFVVGSIMLSGCSKIKNAYYETTISVGTISGDNTYNSFGIFNSKDGIVYYTDPESTIRTPICTKPNCDHQGISPSNPYPSCNAYFSTFVNCSAIVGENFYCVCTPEDKGFFSKEFIKADKDGSNRKVIYKTDDICYFGSGIYEGGYLIYTYYNQEDRNGNKLEKNQIGIIILSLETDEIKRVDLSPAYNGKILTANVVEGNIYYMISYNTEDITKYDYDYIVTEEGQKLLKKISKNEIWRYDISTGQINLYDSCTDNVSSYRLGFGHILKGYKDDQEFEITDLKNQKVNKLIGVDYSKTSALLFDEGVLFPQDGRVDIWRYGNSSVEKIGEYNEDFLSIIWVSDKWVYALHKTSEGYKNTTCKRDEFMAGQFNLRDVDLYTE